MFQDERLSKHLKESSSISNQALVVAEWNMNISSNILKLGNYRYRPFENETLPVLERSVYASIPNSYDIADQGNFYTGATNADVVVDGGFKDDGTPDVFVQLKEKEQMLFSLESCLEKFRPRSGINKLRYFDKKYSHHTNMDMSLRPRYYMSHKEDKFKYWSSFRTDRNQERGIANKTNLGRHFIDDAAPFVIYKDAVPANRLVVKMQTNVGTANLGPFRNSSGSFSDPLFGNENQTTPVRWKIQYLEGISWVDAISFDENSFRRNGSPIIGPDGYVEVAYGLIVPDEYADSYFLAGELSFEGLLPSFATRGESYLVKSSEDDRGSLFIWDRQGDEAGFIETVPTYGWSVIEEGVSAGTPIVKKLVSPDSFISPLTGQRQFREFQNISGIRIVVETMNKVDSTFDLIEFSPRLTADMTEKVVSYSIAKPASDLGNGGLPVGQLLAGTGDVNIFDFDLSFSRANTESIVSKYTSQGIQFKFYEVIYNVPGDQGDLDGPLLYSYYVPLKTMYSEGFPTIENSSRQVTITLRDLFFHFEFLSAPELFITNASLSYAISTVLDYIGFSNYSFKRLEGESDPIIPFFFVSPDTSLAQVLQDLAVSTQSAMFFDEYNNFIVMSKEFMLPSENQRDVDITLIGSKGISQNGAVSSSQSNSDLANIVEVSSQENTVFNDGSIQYTHRYIQRDIGSISQSAFTDKDRTWVYKSSTLWEISPEESTRSVNDSSDGVSTYSLAAIPLNSDLSSVAPFVSGNRVVNNTIDLGEAITFLSRYNGYFYANGEIIKFDAVQFSIPGLDLGEDSVDGSNVWITSVRDYQKYFAVLPFNGKMYPTGLVRIYTEPVYETVGNVTNLKTGPVSRHGRAQFGTPITQHSAGLNSYWSDNLNVRGFTSSFAGLFNKPDGALSAVGVTPPVIDNTVAGEANDVARRSYRSGIIKNFLSSTYDRETSQDRLLSSQAGTVQSSAFVFQGGSFFSREKPIDHVSYVHKPLGNNFKHFGTRVRIVGRVEDDANRSQTPSSSMSYFVNSDNSPNKALSIGGSGGGIAVFVNPTNNTGYYFEIAALTEQNLDDIDAPIADTFFYKVVASQNKAVPVKLWSGLAGNIVDDGTFAGQYRLMTDEKPTFYDLAVEYEDIGRLRRFYLYINDSLVQVVDDRDPLPIVNNMALFIRGTSRCMFENVYAVTANYSQNTATAKNLPANSIFGTKEISLNDAFKKYSISGIIQASYLSGISPSSAPGYSMYYEEFGTIMHEAAYHKVRYNLFPALYAKISPSIKRVKSYVISGFQSGAYGAEFLIFNATDAAISLDDTDGDYLRIQGVTFTQEVDNELTVDDYFNETGRLSDPSYSQGSLIVSPERQQKLFYDVKSSRMTYGKNDFSLAAPYIQSHSESENLMSWIMSKLSRPRLSVGARIFSNPTIQLGDIVNISYKDAVSDQVISEDTRFVVYNIEHSRTFQGPEMTVFLSEVGD